MVYSLLQKLSGVREIAGRLIHIFKCFKKSDAGATIVIFAFSLVLLLITMGAAIDYGRAHSDKSSGQHVADSMVLAAARKLATGDSVSNAKIAASQFFRANLKSVNFSPSVQNAINITRDGPGSYSVQASVTGDTSAAIMTVAGVRKIAWRATAKSAVTIPKIEIVLVADVSASMRHHGRMAAMKDALKDFVDAVFPIDDTRSFRRLSLIPYADSVNFGTDYDSWLNGNKVEFDEFVGCFRLEPLHEVASNQPGGVGPGNYQAFVQSSGRGFPLCPDDGSRALLFSNDPTELHRKVDDLTVGYGTATDIGLSWGWRALTPLWRSHFNNNHGYPKNHTKRKNKFLILFTDGAAVRSDPEGDGENVALSPKNTPREQRVAMATNTYIRLCDNIKRDDDINMYMIAYTLKDRDMIPHLKDCVSGSGRFYSANTENISEIYKNIVADINNFYLTE